MVPTLTTDWLDTDISAYVAFCDDMEIADRTVPMQVWSSESDNKAAAHNPNGDASGIFQLMPATARGLGYPLDADPHLVQFRESGVANQLHWAGLYYGRHKGQLGTVARMYLCTFLPALLLCADDPQHVLAVKANDPHGWYAGNGAAFDVLHKGFITVQDLVDRARRTTGPRTHELMDRVKAYVVENETQS